MAAQPSATGVFGNLESTCMQVRSLCHQLLYTYAANARAAKPAHIMLTSLQVPSGPSGGRLLCSGCACGMMRM